jgi:diaminopimelate decarboxylase
MNEPAFGFGRNQVGQATFSGRPLTELLSEANVSTPAYFYDVSAIRRRVELMGEAFGSSPHLIAYAVKANSAGTIVRTVIEAGAGVDAVSGGELLLARRAGAPARKIVLSGVAKRDDEIELALSEDILAIQAESVAELCRIREIARSRRQVARVSMRLNPSVKIDSHAHIATGHDAAKFGIAKADLPEAFALLAESKDALTLVGLSTHVGSMLKSPDAYLKSARVVCDQARAARELSHPLEYVDFGGGFGIDYGDGPASPPHEFAKAALGLLRDEGLADLMLVVEPGRSIVGSYGVLLSKVVHMKASGERRWLMIDAGMNDLIRPALYQARHRIEPVETPPGDTVYRVVGPVCESTDDFGEYAIGEVPRLVALRDAGAYSFTMASEYNARPLPAEVFVDGGKVTHVNPSPGVEAWLASRLRA